MCLDLIMPYCAKISHYFEQVSFSSRLLQCIIDIEGNPWSPAHFCPLSKYTFFLLESS